MSFYDAMKDAASLAQKADNIDLYRKLLDLSAQALDLQAEVARLKEENTELRKKQELSGRIIRHEEPIITLTDDKIKLFYCSHCWDSEQNLIQVVCGYNGTFECPHCHTTGDYDRELSSEIAERQTRLFDYISFD